MNTLVAAAIAGVGIVIAVAAIALRHRMKAKGTFPKLDAERSVAPVIRSAGEEAAKRLLESLK